MQEVDSRRWAILAAVTLVSFITNVDGTIVIVGLPNLIGHLHMSFHSGLWIITSYLITSTVFLLPAGRWSDMVGAKRIFLFGLAIFTIATILCGVAWSGGTLIVFRFIQGGGAALALATATPIIVRSFPSHELGRAIGINSTSWVIGSIVGPVAGGALISAFGWRSIFYVTVPFALIGMIGAWIVIRDTAERVRSNTDWGGIVTLGFGLVSLLVVLLEGQGWGWLSYKTLSLLFVTIVLWIAFVWTEQRTQHPIFQLGLLRHRTYAIGLAITFTYSIGYFAATFLLTLYLQGALHLSPLKAGLLLVPLSAPQLFAGPFGGAIADKLGPERLIAIGVFFLGIGTLWLGHLSSNVELLAIVLPQLLMSLANSFGWPSLSKAVFSAAPREHTGSASGMFYTIRNIGMALSQTLALAVAEMSVPPDVATQAFLGTSRGTGIAQTPAIQSALVHSTDAGFLFFTVFFAIALCFSLYLVMRQRTNEKGVRSKKIV